MARLCRRGFELGRLADHTLHPRVLPLLEQALAAYRGTGLLSHRQLEASVRIHLRLRC